MTALQGQVKGDEIRVTPGNAGGISPTFKMRDADRATIDIGLMPIVIGRLKQAAFIRTAPGADGS